MNVKHLSCVLFASLSLIGCEEDSVQPTPAPPPTLDEQVVANCRALRDGVEAYASTHDGNFPVGAEGAGVEFTNPYTGGEVYFEPVARFPGTVGYDVYMECDADDRVTGYRITGYGRDHQLITLENLSAVSVDARWIHDITLANAYAVLNAAQEYYAVNGGYPDDLSQGGSDGKTLIDLLPGGQLLVNPADGYKSQPVDGSPGGAGEVGYTAAGYGSGSWQGCFVDFMDCQLTPFADRVFSSQSQEDVSTVSQGYYLRQVVEQFAVEAGQYPHNVDTDETPSGKTVVELLNHSFHDPYTGQVSPPINGIAATRGQVGYSPVEDTGVVVGYIITGQGLFEGIVRLEQAPPAP